MSFDIGEVEGLDGEKPMGRPDPWAVSNGWKCETRSTVPDGRLRSRVAYSRPGLRAEDDINRWAERWAEVRSQPRRENRPHPLDGRLVKSFHRFQARTADSKLHALQCKPHLTDGRLHGLHAKQTQREQAAARVSTDLQIVAAVF